jgi:hypothetical protein
MVGLSTEGTDLERAPQPTFLAQSKLECPETFDDGDHGVTVRDGG